MKALTLTQPWATLVAIGAKSIETRSWSTTYRGPLAIHAAKAMPRWARERAYADPIGRLLGQGGYMLGGDCAALPRGVVVATCQLVDVMAIVGPGDLVDLSRPYVAWWSGAEPGTPDASLHIWGEDEVEQTITDQAPLGDFGPGRFAWLLEDVQAVDPVPATGALGLWEWAA